MTRAPNERAWPRLLVMLGSTVALAGTFMPWLTSGTVGRSSYELVDLIDRLGFTPGGPMDVALTLWPIVPLVLVFAVTATAWQRVPAVVGVALATVGGLYVGAIAVAVNAAPGAALVRLRYGVWVSLAGALLLLAGAVAETVVAVRRDRPTGPASRGPVSTPPGGRS